MIDNENKKKIIEYLYQGYTVESISNELGFPIDEVRRINEQLESERKAKDVYRRNNSSMYSYRKMQDIRKRYFEIYYGDRDAKNIKRATAIQCIKIDTTIAKMQELLKKIEEENDTKKISDDIEKLCTYFFTIKSFPASVEQSKIVADIFRAKVFKIKFLSNYKKNSSIKPNVLKLYSKSKSASMDWFVSAMNSASFECSSEEDYKSLLKYIPSEFEAEDRIRLGSVKTRITNKLNEIRNENTKKRQLEEINPELRELILKIANGDVDKIDALRIIGNEAQNVKSVYGTDSDSTKRAKVILRIGMVLREKTEEFSIKNPVKTVGIIMDLMEKDLELATQIVSTNLIRTHRFKEAEDLFDYYIKKSNDYMISRRLQSQKKKVKLAEVGSIIVKGIWANGTPDEERSYVELIESGLSKLGVDKKDIDLGTTKDGKKSITLADIWNERER